MSIRPINPKTDLDAVIVLYRECFAEPPWHEQFREEDLREEFQAILTWPDAIFLVDVDEAERIIGGAIGFHVCRKPDVCELLAQHEQNGFYVAELFVDSASRKRHVCQRLNETMLRIAQASGYMRASVRTSVNQPVIQHLFVDRLGFRVVAQQDVVSTKWIGGVKQQVPDRRVLMTGLINGRSLTTFERALLRDSWWHGCGWEEDSLQRK